MFTDDFMKRTVNDLVYVFYDTVLMLWPVSLLIETGLMAVGQFVLFAFFILSKLTDLVGGFS